MVKHLVDFVNNTLNMFPRPHNPLLAHTSPDAIVVGTGKPDFNKHVLEFGSYVQTFDHTTNTSRVRILGAIVLGPTGNANGS